MPPVTDRSTGITPTIQNLVFECVRGWVNAGELTATSLAQTPLLGYAFEALKSDALFEEAADLICDVVHETQEIDDNTDVIQLIVPRLIALQPQLAALSDDQDKVRKFARMFSEAGETYRMLILQHPETFMPLVRLSPSVRHTPILRSST
jgi:transportin-3